MAQLAGSLYVASTAVFALMAIVIGVRLELLYRRTRQPAERLLGLGLMGTAGLGYGVMMAGLIGRAANGGADAPAFFWWLTFAGWIFHNLGVMCMLRFIRLVFRPSESWALGLALVMAAVLWISWGFYVALGGITTGLPNTAYWFNLAVVGTYPLWCGAESFRYYRLMRRRMALGLAQPVLVNRFLLWGLASVSATLSIWVVNAPYFIVGGNAGAVVLEGVTTVCMLVTAMLGMTTVTLYWFTFFPPAWYRDRLARTSPPMGPASAAHVKPPAG